MVSALAGRRRVGRPRVPVPRRSPRFVEDFGSDFALVLSCMQCTNLVLFNIQADASDLRLELARDVPCEGWAPGGPHALGWWIAFNAACDLV